MARYPRIDQPCPLDASARRNIAGDCRQCGKTVHCLDGRSDEERAALLRQASGPICVSYRIALGTALALSIAAPAAAGPADAAAPAQTAPMTTPMTTPMTAPAAASQAQTPVVAQSPLEPVSQVLFLGGVSRPGEADWIDDDSSLPELPMRHEPPPRD